MTEPDGVTIEEAGNPAFRHESVWLVWDKGELKQLKLRVGRGVLRAATEEEKAQVAGLK